MLYNAQSILSSFKFKSYINCLSNFREFYFHIQYLDINKTKSFIQNIIIICISIASSFKSQIIHIFHILTLRSKIHRTLFVFFSFLRRSTSCGVFLYFKLMRDRKNNFTPIDSQSVILWLHRSLFTHQRCISLAAAATNDFFFYNNMISSLLILIVHVRTMCVTHMHVQARKIYIYGNISKAFQVDSKWNLKDYKL